ncbi:uncharacterized protein KY384_008804 [Bacidia gigantensis]|uniref:uncharacterized protein n=1 Tax=Bacidia gigantensis TaxID=2732470 RepID=UPI001D04D143|nr:uncharacterized protein KY384_008804 [Bacidia gigantensis]KAG8526603.1 hypothetical protein KY384_008804 [Bacidia gigantensis]
MPSKTKYQTTSSTNRIASKQKDKNKVKASTHCEAMKRFDQEDDQYREFLINGLEARKKSRNQQGHPLDDRKSCMSPASYLMPRVTAADTIHESAQTKL